MIRKWVYQTSIIFVFSSIFIYPHTGTINGIIVDSLTANPMEYVNVSLVSTGLGVSSDNVGNYRLDSVPEGTYTIKFSFLGYKNVERKIKVISGQILVLNIKMQMLSINLSEIKVSSTLEPNLIFTHINKVDIELRPINSSQDILRIVPGLITAQHAGGGKAEQIYLRGFDIDHGTDIDISVDGIPVNMVSHAHGQGYADLHYVIPELIGTVDFNKGPYFSDHGDFNTAGYVNFTTTNSINKNLVKFEIGDFNTFRSVAIIDLLGKSKGNQNAYLAGEFLFSDSYFESPQNFNRINLFGKYTGKLSNENTLNVSISNFTSKWDHSGQIPNRAVNDYNWITRFGAIDTTEGGSTSRFNINAIITTSSNDESQLSNQIYYSKYDFQLWSNFTFWLNDTTNGDQILQKEDRRIYGYKGNYTTKNRFGNSKLKSIFGWGLRYDHVNDLELSHTVNRKDILSTPILGNVNQTNIYFYYDGTIVLIENLVLNLGLRYDHFIFDYLDNTETEYSNLSDGAGIISPKLNLFFSTSDQLQLYLKMGSGFHSNDSRVILQEQVTDALPRAIGADLGTFWKPFPDVLLNFALWSLYLESEFVYVGDEAVIEPSGESFRYGVDLSIRYQLLQDLFVDFDYNYSYGELLAEPEGENFIPLAPRHTSIGGISYKPFFGIGGSIRYRYVSDRPANEDYSVIALGYLLLDLALTYTQPNWQLFIRADNLLASEWNEAQFDTETRLRILNESDAFTGRLEPHSISELTFTPGYPLWIRGGIIFNF
ncbi:MAG: TonB-dependent receptor [Bacteroidota bacterium]